VQRLAHAPPLEHLEPQAGEWVVVGDPLQLDDVEVPELLALQHIHDLGGHPAPAANARLVVVGLLIRESADVAAAGHPALVMVPEGVDHRPLALPIRVMELMSE
jgi:hypothetical protein